MAGRGLALLGGSFNPPHVGHLRLALEVGETLRRRVAGVELLPCAVPPHKPSAGLLPFALRARMVEACVDGQRGLACNRLEGRREGPSYTWDTLAALRRSAPGKELFFIIGSPDYAQLGAWHRGLELPALCHFLVVPRDGQQAGDFVSVTMRLWPGARPCQTLAGAVAAMALPGGGEAHFLPLPWLAVSASRVRALWLAGRSVEFLVPPPALRLLRRHKALVREHWGGGV